MALDHRGNDFCLRTRLALPDSQNNGVLTRLAERLELGAWSLELGAWLRCHVDPIPNSGRAGTTGLAITPKGYDHRFLDDQVQPQYQCDELANQ